ncbi:CPBP family intramembrane glutamic endopeptidase [Aquimarina hainanensis]|uniref:CPBP family intramembrane glutamic endopeptidase n=1 Tax=Aquimarina hainanensis TaxID=1578017 RepID=A0ABW5N5K3_9FLAO|nr:CPBP family intramembrane glutamic endopeptidase [Aquimarina sp. TRL1]QKX06076.1 CPBP family intramembrane metalloprotease [Aquimarina sp. TRL1]
MSTTTVQKQQAFQKGKTYIFWLLLISWGGGFASLAAIESDNLIATSVIHFIYGILPATIAFIFTKKGKEKWKQLKFFKPKLKNVFLAFLIPILYFGGITWVQIALDAKSSPDWSTVNPLLVIIGYPVTVFLVLGEEIGWRGYLQQHLFDALGALKGSLSLGLVWGLWHLPIALNGFVFPEHPYTEAFIIFPLAAICQSILIAYLGYNKYSIFIGAILHASNNHFGSLFVLIPETNNESLSITIYVIFYLFLIGVFGYLLYKKTQQKKAKTPIPASIN